MSGMPFRLDIVETGEQWVVTCATPHGKAASRPRCAGQQRGPQATAMRPMHIMGR